MVEKSIPMSVGDQKTRTVSKVERMTKILIIIIQHYWLNSYLFRSNGEYKTTLYPSGNSRVLRPLCGCSTHRSVLFC